MSSINGKHRNPKYLKDHDLTPSLRAVGPELPSRDDLRSATMILFAIPTQHMRPILKKVVDQLDPDKLPLLVFVNKCASSPRRC